MKRNMKYLSVLILLAAGTAQAAKESYVIDSSRLLRESKEGRSLMAFNQADKEEAMKLEYDQSKKVSDLRAEIEEGMKQGKMTDESLQEKYESLGRIQRNAKHVLEDAREDLEMKTQKRVMVFRNKVLRIAGDYFKKEGNVIVFDKAARQDVVYVSDLSDKTDIVLKEINNHYEKERVKLAMTKNVNRKA